MTPWPCEVVDLATTNLVTVNNCWLTHRFSFTSMCPLWSLLSLRFLSPSLESKAPFRRVILVDQWLAHNPTSLTWLLPTVTRLFSLSDLPTQFVFVYFFRFRLFYHFSLIFPTVNRWIASVLRLVSPKKCNAGIRTRLRINFSYSQGGKLSLTYIPILKQGKTINLIVSCHIETRSLLAAGHPSE